MKVDRRLFKGLTKGAIEHCIACNHRMDELEK